MSQTILEMLRQQQDTLGHYTHWEPAYLKKLKKKKIKLVWDTAKTKAKKRVASACELAR